jgi:hypothetical protein
MADTLSVVESISGKQGWLFEAIKRAGTLKAGA